MLGMTRGCSALRREHHEIGPFWDKLTGTVLGEELFCVQIAFLACFPNSAQV